MERGEVGHERGMGKQESDDDGRRRGDRGKRGERERLLRNGSSDRDFNVEHTRFESIGPLRLAWEPVDMVQQLPLPPQTHPASLPLLLYPSVRDIISVSGNRAPSLQLFISLSLSFSLSH